MQYQTSSASTLDKTVPVSTSISKPLQLVGALLLGCVILYSAGFANISVAHNAAHDTRHSQGFPCH